MCAKSTDATQRTPNEIVFEMPKCLSGSAAKTLLFSFFDYWWNSFEKFLLFFLFSISYRQLCVALLFVVSSFHPRLLLCDLGALKMAATKFSARCMHVRLANVEKQMWRAKSLLHRVGALLEAKWGRPTAQYIYKISDLWQRPICTTTKRLRIRRWDEANHVTQEHYKILYLFVTAMLSALAKSIELEAEIHHVECWFTFEASDMFAKGESYTFDDDDTMANGCVGAPCVVVVLHRLRLRRHFRAREKEPFKTSNLWCSMFAHQQKKVRKKERKRRQNEGEKSARARTHNILWLFFSCLAWVPSSSSSSS